jgi:hypothetical protein
MAVGVMVWMGSGMSFFTAVGVGCGTVVVQADTITTSAPIKIHRFLMILSISLRQLKGQSYRKTCVSEENPYNSGICRQFWNSYARKALSGNHCCWVPLDCWYWAGC